MEMVAALQFTAQDNLDENLRKIEHWVVQAAKNKVKLLVLPENTVLMGEPGDKLKIAEDFGRGKIQTFLSNLAKQHNLWIVAGTIPLKTTDPNRVTASCLVYNEQGNCVARYDKIHLFDVVVDTQEIYQESQTLVEGKEIICVATPVGQLGLSVCYDLRFPELYRVLFKNGAEIIVVPSAFTEITGKAHWEILLRSRAIENISYVIAANQVGEHGHRRKTYGHSMIIDPYGKILDQLTTAEGLVLAEINLPYLHELRRRMPIHQHQRIQ